MIVVNHSQCNFFLMWDFHDEVFHRFLLVDTTIPEYGIYGGDYVAVFHG